jgi:hypothetical protein
VVANLAGPRDVEQSHWLPFLVAGSEATPSQSPRSWAALTGPGRVYAQGRPPSEDMPASCRAVPGQRFAALPEPFESSVVRNASTAQKAQVRPRVANPLLKHVLPRLACRHRRLSTGILLRSPGLLASTSPRLGAVVRATFDSEVSGNWHVLGPLLAERRDVEGPGE